MKFYDYIEIQPLDCYSPLIEPGSSLTEARMADIVRNIIRIADKLGKPVIGNNDVYYTHPHQKIARDIYIMSKRIGGARHPLYPMNRERRLRFVAPDQHLMTTQEILDAFSYLDEDRIREIVIDNPLKIASQIEKLYPIRRNCIPRQLTAVNSCLRMKSIRMPMRCTVIHCRTSSGKE